MDIIALMFLIIIVFVTGFVLGQEVAAPERSGGACSSDTTEASSGGNGGCSCQSKETK